MSTAVNIINDLCVAWCNAKPTKIEPIAQSGSNRQYFKLWLNNTMYIATISNNLTENKAFAYFSQQLIKINVPVPQVLYINQQANAYIQTYVGETDLLTVLQQQGFTPLVYQLFAHSLTQLAQLQIKAHPTVDYNFCVAAKQFDALAIQHDLLYFKFYFFDTLEIDYNKYALLQEIEQLANNLAVSEFNGLMYRDFQSRNIMVDDNNTIAFIDFQGAMQGPILYDVASLLWQAKANLPNEWKQQLFEHYYLQVQQALNKSIDANVFAQQYYGMVLIRLLQVLGAYGFRGLMQQKKHFISSIPLALQNIKFFTNHYQFNFASYPVLKMVIDKMTQEEIIQSFQKNIQ